MTATAFIRLVSGGGLYNGKGSLFTERWPIQSPARIDRNRLWKIESITWIEWGHRFAALRVPMQEVPQPDRADPEVFRSATDRLPALRRRGGATALGPRRAVQRLGLVRYRLREKG